MCTFQQSVLRKRVTLEKDDKNTMVPGLEQCRGCSHGLLGLDQLLVDHSCMSENDNCK